uniref:Basic proline-rich protein-like n=1 Tax=Phascolarctos cinereus TaxID=38626 RepID=A0A6P5JXB9_PHACI|nr:basic proline-rich protein-like [Phascolarctos cinereus]
MAVDALPFSWQPQELAPPAHAFAPPACARGSALLSGPIPPPGHRKPGSLSGPLPARGHTTPPSLTTPTRLARSRAPTAPGHSDGSRHSGPQHTNGLAGPPAPSSKLPRPRPRPKTRSAPCVLFSLSLARPRAHAHLVFCPLRLGAPARQGPSWPFPWLPSAKLPLARDAPRASPLKRGKPYRKKTQEAHGEEATGLLFSGERAGRVLVATPRARAARARFCAACLRAGSALLSGQSLPQATASPGPSPVRSRPGTHHAPLPDHPNTPRPLARPNSAWPFRRQPALGPATHQRAGRTARPFFQTAPAPAPAQDTPMLPAPQARHLGWPGPSAQRSAGSAEPAPACRASGPGALSSSPLRAAPRPGPTPARANTLLVPSSGHFPVQLLARLCNALPAPGSLLPPLASSKGHRTAHLPLEEAAPNPWVSPGPSLCPVRPLQPVPSASACPRTPRLLPLRLGAPARQGPSWPFPWLPSAKLPLARDAPRASPLKRGKPYRKKTQEAHGEEATGLLFSGERAGRVLVASGRGHHACQGGRERVWSCPGGRGAGPLGKKGPKSSRRPRTLLRRLPARGALRCCPGQSLPQATASPGPSPVRSRPGDTPRPLPDHPNTPRPLARPNSAWPFRRQPALGPATHQRAGRTARPFFQTAPAPAPAQDTPMLPAPQARHLGWPGPSAQRSAGSAEPAPACRASGPGALSSSPLRAAPRPGPTPARATRCSSPALALPGATSCPPVQRSACSGEPPASFGFLQGPPKSPPSSRGSRSQSLGQPRAFALPRASSSACP